MSLFTSPVCGSKMVMYQLAFEMESDSKCGVNTVCCLAYDVVCTCTAVPDLPVLTYYELELKRI